MSGETPESRQGRLRATPWRRFRLKPMGRPTTPIRGEPVAVAGVVRCVRRVLIGSAATLAVLTASAVFGQQGTASQAAPEAGPAQRPRVGLVLAGGGAKGGAHVGVLKVLEEMHVPIDCIAGTSMGALVGGGYASGIPAAQMETLVR